MISFHLRTFTALIVFDSHMMIFKGSTLVHTSFSKLCPIFVGSVDTFGKRYEKEIGFLLDQIL